MTHYLQFLRIDQALECNVILSFHARLNEPCRLVEAVPDEGMGRIARFFLLGGQDASDSSNYNSNNNYGNNQFGNNFGLGNKDTSNLLNLNLNSREIQEVQGCSSGLDRAFVDNAI